MDAKELKWGPAPPSLPPGAQVAVLHGDPGKTGPFVLRLMLPRALKLLLDRSKLRLSLIALLGHFTQTLDLALQVGHRSDYLLLLSPLSCQVLFIGGHQDPTSRGLTVRFA